MKPLTMLAQGALCMTLLLGNACQKPLTQSPSPGRAADASSSSGGLITYKNSPHHPFVGYLVADGNDPAASVNPANAPDSVDFLEFFAGRDTVRNDWRLAQAKGTRIVVCHFVSDAYFDGSVNDPSDPGTATTPTATSTYDHWAAAMYQQHIVQDSLDGIDLDIETGTLGGEVPNATALQNLLISVARYFGPNATSALTVMGKKPVFFFDTDGSVGGGVDGSYYTNYASNYDYVLFQAYTTGSHYWSGSGTASFGPLVTTYGLSKLIFLVNGDSFSPTDPTVGNDLLGYAQWVVSNNGCGVGAYRMSRDYNDVPPFTYTHQAIQIMNPAATDTTGLVSGATYKIVSAVNNSSVLDVTSSGTANGTKVQLYTDNGTNAQRWQLTSLGGGYYNLQPACAPGSMMDVSNSGTANGTQVQIYATNGTNAQRWLITSLGGGFYSLSPACAPGSDLDDNAQGTANGNKIQIWTANGTVAQQWKFVQE